MPRYLIAHTAGPSGNTYIDEPELAVELSDSWAVFTTPTGLALAVPAQHIAYIQRDDDQPDEE
ncbi:hypothetical protein OG432_24460 [Streptomyces sp. NBC_00442]|uniref:hypothetical protein n=1 Tax=Streptomyces sp. NBC_00442 TaxID=2903651 RepID=UPI002E2119D9